MGEANEGKRSRAMEKFSLQTDKYPRDLLQRFTCSGNSNQSQFERGGRQDSEEIELNLGLSLGGRFGVDKNPNKKLIRSSSIAGTIPLLREETATTPPSTAATYSSLIRTSSLPTETEEEWRKRKELQTLRRLEAKRRRSEKQRNKGGGYNSGSGVIRGCLDEERRENEGLMIGLNLRENSSSNIYNNNKQALPFGLPNWAAATRQALVGGAVLGQGGAASQGSIESQGGSSSGMSELESKPLQGSSSCGEARSPCSNQPITERGNQDTMGSSGTKPIKNLSRTSSMEMEINPSKKPESSSEHRTRKEIGVNAVKDMPCVFTIGDGPNGRKVEGILYKYGKGEEVWIMCVCHGDFLSPAEFVKHAGGGEVAHPLRHIVVNPNSSSSLL